LLNKLVEELEEIYQYGSRLKIATEEETEAVLKELEEQKKQKEIEENEKAIIAKKSQIKEILAARLLENKKEKNSEEHIIEMEDFNINDKIKSENPELYKGEIVVVQMEDEEDNIVIDLDFSKKDRAEIFGLLE